MFPVENPFPLTQLQANTFITFSEPGRPNDFLKSLSYFFIKAFLASLLTESFAFEISCVMDTRVDCKPTENFEKKLPELSKSS